MKTTGLTKKKRRSGRLGRFARAREAVSALEYAILVGIIAVGIAAVLAAFSDQIETAIGNIGDGIEQTTSFGTPGDGS